MALILSMVSTLLSEEGGKEEGGRRKEEGRVQTAAESREIVEGTGLGV